MLNEWTAQTYEKVPTFVNRCEKVWPTSRMPESQLSACPVADVVVWNGARNVHRTVSPTVIVGSRCCPVLGSTKSKSTTSMSTVRWAAAGAADRPAAAATSTRSRRKDRPQAGERIAISFGMSTSRVEHADEEMSPVVKGIAPTTGGVQ
jgi:hypothetical protein